MLTPFSTGIVGAGSKMLNHDANTNMIIVSILQEDYTSFEPFKINVAIANLPLFFLSLAHKTALSNGNVPKDCSPKLLAKLSDEIDSNIFKLNCVRPRGTYRITMRLLNTSILKVNEFFENAIPPYAILSHTWGEEEVTLQDMLSATPPSHKKGYQKLLHSCKQAKSDDFEYIWIDTCCIDKSSSSELSEAINSMFQWYKRSSICYIYLSDFQGTAYLGISGRKCQLDTQSTTEITEIGTSGLKYQPGELFTTDPTGLGSTVSNFEKSRWFTRGWTLQELIAPGRRIFFSADWTALGYVLASRTLPLPGPYKLLPGISTLLSNITGIDVKILTGSKSLSEISIAQKISWAAERKTSRREDIAYCLMGIFDVNMPLLYGEGMKAFSRLQEEILKTSDDGSLFAHTTSEWDRRVDFSLPSILAPSPKGFSGWGDIEISQSETRETLVPSVPATWTSKGLRIQLPLCWNTGFRADENVCLALLDCKFGGNSLSRLAVPLVRLSPSGDQFRRLDSNWLPMLNPGRKGPESVLVIRYRKGKRISENSKSIRIEDIRLETIYVVSDDFMSRQKVRTPPYFRLESVLESPGGSLLLENVYPRELWDEEALVLRCPTSKWPSEAWISGVLSFRDKNTGLILDVVLGGRIKSRSESGHLLQKNLEPWCRVTCVDDSARNMPESSDKRLTQAFYAAEYSYINENVRPTTSCLVGPLVARVDFETTEFLGRPGYAVQVKIS